MIQKSVQDEQPLVAADEQNLRQELHLPDPASLKPAKNADPKLEKKADENVSQLIHFSESDHETQSKSKAAVEEFGLDLRSPKTEQDWLNNMRVEFRIIQVEAEESVFVPL